MSIEQHEQPGFESPENKRPSNNIIEGPWSKQTSESEVESTEPADQEPAVEEPRDNVLFGPWLGSRPEAVPEFDPPSEPPEEPAPPEEPPAPTPPETEEERTEKLEMAREKLNELSGNPDNQEKTASETKSKEPEESAEDTKVRFPFSEQLTEYKQVVCEKCKGTGRFLLVFKCPVCKGLGQTSVPDRTTSQSGYYEVKK